MMITMIMMMMMMMMMMMIMIMAMTINHYEKIFTIYHIENNFYESFLRLFMYYKGSNLIQVYH